MPENDDLHIGRISLPSKRLFAKVGKDDEPFIDAIWHPVEAPPLPAEIEALWKAAPDVTSLNTPADAMNMANRIPSASMANGSELLNPKNWRVDSSGIPILGPKPSLQSAAPWRKQHPFDMKAATAFQISNTHHSTCLQAKASSTVGMGFQKDTTADKLNAYCETSFLELLHVLGEDYHQTGNAYLEVVRDRDRNIQGLYWIPSAQVYIAIENAITYERHYEVFSHEGAGMRVYARYGDLDKFLNRRKNSFEVSSAIANVGLAADLPDNRVGEIIHFKRMSTLSRWYGMPDWLAAVAAIELVQMLKQHNFDFFNNRGVGEFLLWLIGADLSKADCSKIEESLKANIGLGNRFKSNFFQLTNPNAKVQLEQLKEAAPENQFVSMSEVLAHEIVSAHRVPPLLAGIQIPGRIGAANELPNALVAFQILVIGPAQHNFETTLNETLGDPETNGDLGLKKGDFALRKITEQIDIAAIDTMARMQDAAASPAGQQRLSQFGGVGGLTSADQKGPRNPTASPNTPSDTGTQNRPGSVQQGLGGTMLKEDEAERVCGFINAMIQKRLAERGAGDVTGMAEAHSMPTEETSRILDSLLGR